MPGRDLLSHRWSQSIRYRLAGVLILTALRKQGKASLVPRRRCPKVGVRSPQHPPGAAPAPSASQCQCKGRSSLQAFRLESPGSPFKNQVQRDCNCWAGFLAGSLAGWKERFPSSPGRARHCLSPQSTYIKEQRNKVVGF